MSAGTVGYRDFGGPGPVLVFLHGLLMDGRVWDQVAIPLAADGYRCVVPDLPFGAHRHALSPDADLSIRGVVALVAELMDRLELEDATVVCNDWGGAQLLVSEGLDARVARLGLVACEAFENYPPGINGRLVCLLARLPGGLFITAEVLRPRLLRHLPITFGALSKRRVPDELFREWNRQLRTVPGVRRDLRTYLTHVPRRAQFRTWAEQQRRFLGPVLIVWARQDSMMPARHADQLAAHFTNSTLIWVEDSRTLVPVDQPDALVEALRTFLDTTPPARVRHQPPERHD